MPTVKKAPSEQQKSGNGKPKYPEIFTQLRGPDFEDGPLTVDEAKDGIGWVEEPEDEDWGSDFALKDVFGHKIRLLNNPSNRPLKISIAKRYMSEFLRHTWKLNLETIVYGKSGELRDGQHRLVGFILAEQHRSLNPRRYGSEPLTMEVLMGYGVSDDKDTADSYDLGQKRSLDDVIYRHESFAKKVTDNQQRKISKVLSHALRLAWIRTGGKTVSRAPHFPNTEALAFYDKHKKIMDSVKYIMDLHDGDGEKPEKNFGKTSLGYLAALHYLMSDVDKDKANEFFELLATGEDMKKGHPVLLIRDWLAKEAKASSGEQRDELVGRIIKAWNFFLEDAEIQPKDLAMKRKKQGERRVLAECPRIGGMDKEVEKPEELKIQELVTLNALASQSDGTATYDFLVEETGIPKATLSRIIYGDAGLTAGDLLEIDTIEIEEGDTGCPYIVKITEKGLSKIR